MTVEKIIKNNNVVFRRLGGELPDAEHIPPEYVDKITEAIALLAEPAGYLKGTYEGFLLEDVLIHLTQVKNKLAL